MLTVNTLQITLQHPRKNNTGDLWPVLSVFKVPDSKTSAIWVQTNLQWSLPDWQTKLLTLAINPAAYGEFLGKALFHSDLKKLVHTALATTEMVRLMLVIEPSELRSLHWERLYFPDTDDAWRSFAQNQRLVFSYYSPASVKRYYSYLLQRHLKVLFFICSPVKDEALGSKAFTAFDTEVIAASIRITLGRELPCIQATILYEAADTSWKRLQAELNTHAYNLVHIISHGFYTRGDHKSYLLLLDDQQRIRAVSAEEFVNALTLISNLPHLLFFSSCNSADPEAAHGGYGNFAQIVRDKLATPAVVAMTDRITQDTANIISAAFYGHLYEQAFADLALAKAGHKLIEYFKSAQRADRYLPVLYQDLGNKALFGFEPKALNELDAKELADGFSKLEQVLEQRAPKSTEQFEELKKQSQAGECLAALDEFCREITDVSFASLAQNELEKVLAPYNAECPFPGMRPFKLDLSHEVDYRKYFFGRDAIVQQVCEKLANPERKVLAIIGPSGSGKSSLAFAGVLKRFEQLGYKIHTLRPYFQDSNGQVEQAHSYLNNSLKDLELNQPTLLYIDQFEEIFTAYNKEERQAFLQRLLGLPKEAGYSQLKILLTMRADYAYEEANQEPLLKPLIDDDFYLVPMNIDELRAAMEQQVDSVGLEFEQGLAHRILHEAVMDEPGAMPLLQHLLWLLWQHRRGRHLRIQDYEAIGGVAHAIAKTADELFVKYAPPSTLKTNNLQSSNQPFINELFFTKAIEHSSVPSVQAPSEIQFYLQNIFLRLTRPDSHLRQSLTSQYRDTRQRIPKNSLYPEKINPQIIDDLLKELADARLVVTYEHEIEIAHEALITHWPKLKDWLKNRQLMELRQDLSESSLKWWDAQKKGEKKLAEWLKHTGSEIELIDKQQNAKAIYLNEVEVAYLAACRRRDLQVEKNKKNAYRFAVLMAFLLVINTIISYFAFEQKNKVDNQLAVQQFQKGIEVRDSVSQESDKAKHYFSKALDKVNDRRKREIIKYAYADLNEVSSSANSIVLRYKAGVKQAILFAESTKLLTWGEDNYLKIWNLNNLDDPIEFELEHSALVLGAILFADEKRILSWSEDGRVNIWDITTAQLIGQLAQHDGLVMGAALFAHDQRILTWSQDGTARVWDIDTGKALGQPLPHDGAVIGAIVFAHDQRVLTWSQDGTARVWDSATGKALGQPLPHDGAVMGATVFANDQRILTWSQDGTVRVWDSATMLPIGLTLLHSSAVLGASLSTDEQRILTWSQDGTARVWDSAMTLPIGPPLQHSAAVLGATLSTDGQSILTWSEDGTVSLWDSTTGALVSPPLRHSSAVKQAIILNIKNQVLTWTEKGEVYIWNLDNKQNQFALLYANKVRKVSAFANDSKLLIWGKEGIAQIVSAEKNSVLATIKHQGAVTGSSVFSNDLRLLTWGEDNTVKVSSVPKGLSLGNFPHPSSIAYASVFDKEAHLLIVGGNTLNVWDIPNTQLIDSISLDHPPTNALQLTDEGLFLLWFDNYPAEIWDMKTKLRLGVLADQATIKNALVFANHKKILTWGSDAGKGKAQIWDFQGQKLGNPITHDQPITGVKLLADESKLVVWGGNTGQFWSLTTATPVKKGPALKHEDTVWGATTFAKDKLILTWSEDQVARVWDSNGLPKQLFKHHEPIRNAFIFMNDQLVATQGVTGIRIWDVETGSPVTRLIRHKENMFGSLVLEKQNRLILWGGNSVSGWSLPKSEDTTGFLHELHEAVKTGFYLAPSGDLVFIDKQGLTKCSVIYKEYENCAGTDASSCVFKKVWWTLERFFYQGPQVEDCMTQ